MAGIFDDSGQAQIWLEISVGAVAPGALSNALAPGSHGSVASSLLQAKYLCLQEQDKRGKDQASDGQIVAEHSSRQSQTLQTLSFLPLEIFLTLLGW